ncbi:MAG: zinc-ribbon domain-containing protein [Desulfomonilia bacterium]|jgi:predicted Zn finger-like uncharacterized protein
MVIVNCPSCHSKFRFSQEGLTQGTIKMRCSVCQHVFSYTMESDVSLEKEFDILLSSKPVEAAPAVDESLSAQESVLEEASMEISETPPESKSEGSQAATESVIREIDSILGTGSDAAETEEESEPQETEKKSHLKIAVLIICLIVAACASLWLLRDKIPFFHEAKQESPQATLLKGPFFSIDEHGLTYEMLTHEQEGSVLVIKGNLRKITAKPVESVMVEARVYDKTGKLIESRLAYAGIVPDTSEFTKQPQKDIDALLTSDPASPGSTLPSSDIPFAVAFFGKPAQEVSSFQVEVKDIRWK